MQVLFSVFVLFTLRVVSASPSGPKNIIIDTDFLSFPDDAGALALTNAFEQLGKVRILGIASNINSRYSIPAIDAINTYYNHPNIPFAQNRSVTNEITEPSINASTIPVFVTTLANSSLFPEDIHDGSNKTISAPLNFYKHILSQAQDKSVTILGIGFLNNLHELYHSEGGKELIEKKVVELVVQGGSFGPNQLNMGPNGIGYNLATNLTAAKVLPVWPSPVTYLGDDVGSSVFTGAILADTPESNPVRVAYDIFLSGPGKTHPSWDLMATYYGVLGISEGSFKYGNDHRGGRIEIYSNGTASWNYTAVVPFRRRQHFLDLKESNDTIARKIDHFLSVLPARGSIIQRSTSGN